MIEICGMRRITADIIFDGRELYTDHRVLLLHEDGRIIDMVTASDAGTDVEHYNGLLLPGFVNAHCHLELSHMKGMIPEHTGMVPFLLQVAKQRGVEKELIMRAMQEAVAEMESSGVVAVGDICNTADSISVKAKSSIQWHQFIEVFGSDHRMAEQRINAALQVQAQFRDALPQFSATLTPHAPYSISPLLYQLLSEAIGSSIITMHNQESIAENELFLNGNGDFLELYRQLNPGLTPFWPSDKRSLSTWLPQFPQPNRIMMVHNVDMNANDVDFAQAFAALHQQQHYYCVCLRANQYIQNVLPPLAMLRKKDCTLVVGTDSLASNHSLNMLDELRAIQHAFEDEITLCELLQWVTLNGAAALKMENNLGSFDAGKKPGVLLMENLQAYAIVPETRVRRLF